MIMYKNSLNIGESTSKANIVANVAELALAAYNCHDKF